MTNIEQEFMKVFGIEPKKVKICINATHCPQKYKLCNKDCEHWQVAREDYPKITDRVLLKLIGVLNKFSYDKLGFHEYEEAKEEILQMCITVLDEEKHHYTEIIGKVQSLFREEGE